MRPTGYYWVRVFNSWYIALWQEPIREWAISGFHMEFTDHDLQEIDEREIVRPEAGKR